MSAYVTTTASDVTALDLRPLYDCEHPDGHVSVCVNLGGLAIWFPSIADLDLWWQGLGIEIARYDKAKTSEDATIESASTV